MYLVRLVYTSTVNEGFDEKEIEDILGTARQQNGKLSVTGMLCFNQEQFLQCLEGSRSNVNQIYHRILNDPRHRGIILLEYREIDQREFADWKMGYIPGSALTRSTNLKFSNSCEFQPRSMSGESAHRLMMELRDVVPTV